MEENIKKTISENLGNILNWLFISVTSGSASAFIVTIFEKKILKNVSLGIVITSGIVCVSIIYLIVLKNLFEKKIVVKEYTKVLRDIDNILDLKEWENFIYGAGLDRFPKEIYRQRDDINSYMNSIIISFPKKEKKMKEYIDNVITKYNVMFTQLSRHLISNPDGSIYYIDKFYHGCDDSNREKMELEYDSYHENLVYSINEYRNSLNQLSLYIHQKKYDFEGTSWEHTFPQFIT